MAAVIQDKKIVAGGSFLIEERTTDEVFTPEDFTEEHRMIADTTREFVDNEVRPNLEAMENHAWEVARELLKKGGDLGLLGSTIPEEYGGLGLDQTTGVIIAEMMAAAADLVLHLVHIHRSGCFPSYFGSEELKKTWIPRIVSGEVVSAYCLTESGSGSDALGAKTTARLTETDSIMCLTARKCLSPKESFADVYIVFARVDSEKEKFSVPRRAERKLPARERRTQDGHKGLIDNATDPGGLQSSGYEHDRQYR